MAASSCSVIFRIILALLCFAGWSLGFGINYGQIANDLPSPQRVAGMLRTLNVTRVKLYDADPKVLSAFANTGVGFVVGLGNEYLANMTDPIKAQNWVSTHLSPHLPATKITAVLVGNEVFGTSEASDRSLRPFLLPAMQTVHAALVDLGLADRVTVTTAHSLNILSSSFPPSAGAFRADLAEYLQPLISFHAQIKSPFLINAYPFFSYKGDPSGVAIDYVLFEPNEGMTDPATGLHYDNMLFAQIDAVYAAIRAMGHNDVEVRVSETGWPSRGDPDETGATPRNAALYNGNLLRRLTQRAATPAMPNLPVDVFVFALFNENQKPGPASERNYGLFYPDGTPVYDIGFRAYLPELAMDTDSAHHHHYLFKVFSIFNFMILLVTYLICCQGPSPFS